MIYVLVTGTSTGVGKTITTAAMAVALSRAGLRIGVVKPVQTGADGDDPGDASVVRRLTGLADVAELVTLPEPLAPDSAARLRGTQVPAVADLAARIAGESSGMDIVIVEGAGGVLVRLDTDGGTLLDLGAALATPQTQVCAVIVTVLSLGTLNHTELTAAAIRAARLRAVGLVIGSLPGDPARLGLAERCNRTELPRVTGLPVLAELPAGAGSFTAEAFQSSAPTWFDGLPDAIQGAAARQR